MTKTKTLFSLETSVHVHFHCVAFLSRSALPSGRESWPGQYLLRLRHEIVRGCQVVPQILQGMVEKYGQRVCLVNFFRY